jgi:hypothetical protein
MGRIRLAQRDKVKKGMTASSKNPEQKKDEDVHTVIHGSPTRASPEHSEIPV